MRRLSLAIVLLLIASWVPTVRAQQAEKNRIELKIHVPQSDAKLEVEGQLTQQKGEVRLFASPPVDPKGQFTYTLKVTWEPNNYTKITRLRVVDVAPGKEIEVDLKKSDPRWKDDIVVRYVPTPNQVVEAMCKLANVGPEDVVYDLGCGDGRMVIIAVEEFGAKKGIGVDLDPKLVAESKANAKKSKVADRLEFRQGDVLKIDDLPDASVVLLYMGQDINERLKPILQARLKPGSRVVSHRFTMGDDWPPTRSEVVSVKNVRYEIHLWVIGEGKK